MSRPGRLAAVAAPVISPTPRPPAAIRGVRVRTDLRAGSRELSTTLVSGALEGPKKPPVDGEQRRAWTRSQREETNG